MLKEAHIQGVDLTSPPPVSLLGFTLSGVFNAHFLLKEAHIQGVGCSPVHRPFHCWRLGEGHFPDTFSDGKHPYSQNG